MTRAAPTGGWIRRLAPYLLAHRRNVTIALGAAIGGQAVAAFVPVLQKVVVWTVIALGFGALAGRLLEPARRTQMRSSSVA